MKHKKEIEKLANEDQKDRTKYFAKELSQLSLWERDKIRLKRVRELIDEGEINTAKDHRDAAIVFQHGLNEKNERDLDATFMAVKMMQKAIELDPQTNKWLLAAAIDRNLMVRKLPQIYGTQYIRKDENSPWEKYLMDSDKVSDEERKEYGVESFAEQKLTLERMNKKILIEKYQANGSTDDIIKYCKENHGKTTEYDLSWRGISKFGFQLKRLDKIDEALQIFHTSIELYPEEYDLYHSIGLIYAELGKKEIGIKFLEKAVELNPNFEEGKRDLKELKNV